MREDFQDWKGKNIYRDGIEAAQSELRKQFRNEGDSCISSAFGAAMEEFDGYHLGIPSALEALSKSKPSDFGFYSNQMNTFPFGKPTKTVHDSFFGICSTGTSLSKAFSALCTYCNSVGKFQDGKVREAVLFTDRWNPNTFAKYELQFLNYSAHNSVRVLIFLVTDYGISRIPFFDCMQNQCRSIPELDNEIEIELFDEPIYYRFRPGTLQITHPCEEYTIHLAAHSFTYDIPPEHGTTRLSDAKVKRFIQAVSFMYKNRELAENNDRICDSGYCDLVIFGMHFSWDARNPAFAKVERALAELLGKS